MTPELFSEFVEKVRLQLEYVSQTTPEVIAACRSGEDFEVCVQNYKELPMVVPVDNNGKLTKDAGQFEGLTTDEANKAIAIYLEEHGNLLALQKIIHQYPHCWRCKEPVIFRRIRFCKGEYPKCPLYKSCDY